MLLESDTVEHLYWKKRHIRCIVCLSCKQIEERKVKTEELASVQSCMINTYWFASGGILTKEHAQEKPSAKCIGLAPELLKICSYCQQNVDWQFSRDLCYPRVVINSLDLFDLAKHRHTLKIKIITQLIIIAQKLSFQFVVRSFRQSFI